MTRNTCSYETCFSDGILEVTLCGEIDHHHAVSIRTGIDEVIWQKRPSKTVLDLSGIEFMDSSGLGLIMGRYSLMQKLGGSLTLRNPNKRIVKIFDLAGLGRMILIEPENSEKDKSTPTDKQGKEKEA